MSEMQSSPSRSLWPNREIQAGKFEPSSVTGVLLGICGGPHGNEAGAEWSDFWHKFKAVVLDRWGADLGSQWALVMFGDNFGCHNWVGGAAGIQRVEV